MITYTLHVTKRHPWFNKHTNSFGHIEDRRTFFYYSTLEIDGVSACIASQYSYRIALEFHRLSRKGVPIGSNEYAGRWWE